MRWPGSLGALTWVLIAQVLVSSAHDLPVCQDLAQYVQGGCCMVDRPDLPCPKLADYQTSTGPAPACTSAQECSTTACTGVGWCERGMCQCNSPTDGEAPSTTCNAPPECSVLNCTGGGKTVACESATCRCSSADGGQRPPTPIFVPTQVTQDGGATANVVVIQGGPITSPITLISPPLPTIDVAGAPFHSTLTYISSQVETSILPLATSWANTPDAGKAAAAIQAIETLLPTMGEIANGLPDGQKIFGCPAIAAPPKRQSALEVTLLLQKISCGLLRILESLEKGQSSTDPSLVGHAQEGVRAGGDTIRSNWEALDGMIGGTAPPITCSADAECASMSNCEGIGKQKICKEGKCFCKIPASPLVCSASEECTSLPDCEGVGKGKICQDGQCTCQSPYPTLPPNVCTNDGQCASLPDCGGTGRKRICQSPACVCMTEGEAVVSTTITALPPEASIETITAQVTENMATTTKRPGSDEPTVVPIIVPVGKPPVICWRCVNLPANIQLKLPEFCVQILGLKLGNCPSDDNDNNDDGNENEDKTTITTCSTTVTATYASTFCTVTREPGQPERRKRDEGCSTLEYETKTACEAITGSTTTTTTTVQPEPTLCSPKTCGGGACLLNGRELVRRAPPAPKGQPNPGSWFGPEHYTNNFEFMRGEVYKAYQDPSSSVNLNLRFEISTGRWARWAQEVKTVALAGLWGCTSVIAVSKRGVWVAHFWEGRDDLVMLTLGEFTGGSADYLDEGLGMFRGKPGAPHGNMFDDDAEPQVFILTRKARPSDLLGAPGDVALLTRIRSELNTWWQRGQNRGPQREIEYDPIIPPTYESTDPRYPGDPEFFLFRGKAMVQFQPAIACRGGDSTTIGRRAGYRVWVEAEKLADGEKTWSPTGDTANDQTMTLHDVKRQESCPVEGGKSGDPNGQEGEDDGSQTGTTPPPKKTCSTDAECSGPDCAGGGSTSFCDAGVCGCRASQAHPPPRKQCSSNADCSGAECAGHKVQYLCETGFCVCKGPKDPSICTSVDTCGYLECNSGQERACADGKCQCVEKTCSNVDGCGFISCPESQEKACTDGKCRCKDKPPPFASGICNTHIRIYGSEKSFAANIIVYDGSGVEIYRIPDLNQKHSWGETITLSTGKLPYELKYEFLDRDLGSNKRDRPPPGSLGPNPLRYQAYSVRISAGNTVWSTMDEDDARQKVPRCEVGRWDNHGTWDPEKIINDVIQGIMGQEGEHPTRDMDCRWQC